MGSNKHNKTWCSSGCFATSRDRKEIKPHYPITALRQFRNKHVLKGISLKKIIEEGRR
jgi:hypothetical protein